MILSCLVILAFSSPARQAAGKTGKGDKPAAKKHYLPWVFLGNSSYKGGPINKDDFKNLLKDGLTARDTFGVKYKVIGFEFSYGERNLYEDSAGNSMILTDYLTEFCPGNMVTPTVAASMADRVKAGDSVYFDQIKVLRYINATETVPASDAILGIGMKFGLTK